MKFPIFSCERLCEIAGNPEVPLEKCKEECKKIKCLGDCIKDFGEVTVDNVDQFEAHISHCQKKCGYPGKRRNYYYGQL